MMIKVEEIHSWVSSSRWLREFRPHRSLSLILVFLWGFEIAVYLTLVHFSPKSRFLVVQERLLFPVYGSSVPHADSKQGPGKVDFR